ncbi:hypothetical protein F5Y16DRAFT_406973 [Xylariaceae sp. FL0255]|nr:hypothetical protein F5Y16DRAFT_406973 [Xylariaceae sp. FL0255]
MDSELDLTLFIDDTPSFGGIISASRSPSMVVSGSAGFTPGIQPMVANSAEMTFDYSQPYSMVHFESSIQRSHLQGAGYSSFQDQTEFSSLPSQTVFHSPSSLDYTLSLFPTQSAEDLGDLFEKGKSSGPASCLEDLQDRVERQISSPDSAPQSLNPIHPQNATIALQQVVKISKRVHQCGHRACIGRTAFARKEHLRRHINT